MTGTKARTAIAVCALVLTAVLGSGETAGAAAATTDAGYRARPACVTKAKTKTNYQTPVQLKLSCTGTSIAKLKLVRGPSHGALRNRAPKGGKSRRTLTVTYVPDKLFVGTDRVKLEALEAGSRTPVLVRITVLPWRMRAFGDSATAGYGFLGTTGNEVVAITACEPIEPLNDRCSSNSDLAENSTAKLSWIPGYGLSKKISWAAQFASQWQGGGHITAPEMFQNRAVTGSRPVDWLPKGQLNPYLENIVTENPDLIAFTLGVNPLLDRILIKDEKGVCIENAETVKVVIGCIESIFSEEKVQERLEAVYKALLGAPSSKVVTFQYHNAYPNWALAVDEFEPWQVEAIIGHLNAKIAAAVAAVKKAMPTQAKRLTLIEAQVDPRDKDPRKVPRFNVGIAPEPSVQPWPGVFECGVGVKVDGPSHQVSTVQTALKSKPGGKFCGGNPWTITADTGIHPNKEGYAQFAKALTGVARADGLVPTLP